MSIITCGFSGRPGVHAVVLPSGDGQPVRCEDCSRCAAELDKTEES